MSLQLINFEGSFLEINPAKITKPKEIAKQAANPYSWKTQPDKSRSSR